jgi:hypothetical protein
MISRHCCHETVTEPSQGRDEPGASGAARRLRPTLKGVWR